MTLSHPPHDDAAVFPLLADPAGYRPCPWDLAVEHGRRPYWIDLFRGHFVSLLEHATRVLEADGQDPAAAVMQARDAFHAYLDRVAQEPTAFGPLNVLTICQRREDILRAAGIADPYRLIKHDENTRAMKMLPGLLAQLDALPSVKRHTALIEGVFAGNIFDMGAVETLQLYEAGEVDFASVRAKLKPRPWRFDALEAWLGRMARAERGRPYRGAVLFVDNAGPDVVLGMIPFARELVKQGTPVILAANTEPSLNDVTHDELTALVAQAAVSDPVLAEAMNDRALRLVASGNWAPLIDLSRVSPGLVAEVESVPIELVVLEGMGRSIESNMDAAFRCDALWLAMIKDAGVAEAIGAQPFDLAMRYAPIAG
ncbi:MAG: ARMT1-like domain-containing protein [Phycisphaerales bacterium JB063]